ncbi:MAG: TIGR00282 family metallophosphoesterase [Epsilonproteobacteria bacterium]|nr:TIGR00282 family metallophosphoesterase [Campylobacterota bacterium]
MSTVRILCIGDIIGLPGQQVFAKWIDRLKQEHAVDAVLVNGENAAKNGRGITPQIIDFFKEHGVSVVTTGNHVWGQKNVYNALNERNDIVRPANYPPACPGRGYAFFTVNKTTVAVINVHGRVFIPDSLDCPFRTIESLLTFVGSKTNVILVDMHAEATSEKRAMGFFLDGKVSAVYGTHTHIQTADEQILPQGTGYLTDLGGCGPLNSIIGVNYDQVMAKILSHPKASQFTVQTTGPMVLSGIWFDIDTATGKTVALKRIRLVDNDIVIDTSKK